MPNFTVKNKDFLKTLDPTGKLLESLQSIEDEVNAQKQQTGATGVGQPQTPSAPQGIAVTAAGGIFQIAITPSATGVNYFLEYSTSQAFSNPRQIAIGPALTYRANLGNQILYWRVKAGASTAPHGAPLSAPVYFGNPTPNPVQGGGSAIGPPA